jgi:hypothetical protein
MASELHLHAFLALLLDELAAAEALTTDAAAQLGLSVRDVRFDVPVRLAVKSDGLVIGLPSARETPGAGQLGRLEVIVASTRSEGDV